MFHRKIVSKTPPNTVMFGAGGVDWGAWGLSNKIDGWSVHIFLEELFDTLLRCLRIHNLNRKRGISKKD